MVPTGYINLAYNEDIANAALIRNEIVLAVCDVIDERIYPSDNLMQASLLLPPPECISVLIDESKEIFASSYADYLMCREVDLYLLAITVGVIFKGSKLWLYMGSHEDNDIQMDIFNVLANYMAEVFGLFVGVPNTPQMFTYDASFDWFNLNRMYENNLIDVMTLIANYPSGNDQYPIPPNICLKITEELNLQRFYFPEQMIDYVNQYKDKCQKNNALLEDPLVTVDLSINS